MRDKSIKVIITFLVLLFLSSIFNFSPTITSKNENFQINTKENKPKTSKFWNLTGSPILIDDSDPSKNWSYTASHYDWCSGSGSWADPYVIENVTINGQGSGNCIEIWNSNIYFIIQNCSLYNSGSSNNAGIKLGNINNSKIINTNCSDNNYQGIHLYISFNNTLSGNTVNNNNDGIYLRESDNNTLSGNTVNNNNDGIYLWVSNNNTLSGNTVNNNNDGIYIWVSNNNTLSGNTASNNSDEGIHLLNSDNNTLSGNTASNNSDEGIYISGSNNMFSGNTASNNNHYGIYISGSNNMFSGNTASNNSDDGIYISGSNNMFSGNTASNNSDDGIYISGGNNALSGNIASNNSHYGIYIYYSDNNALLGNTANNNNYAGIYIRGSNNTLSGNNANNNNNGIRISGSNNTLSGNTANNKNYGISLYGSSNNTLFGNTANNNSCGIYIYYSDNNTLSGNNANNNYNGIYLSSSNNNALSGNTASNNSHYGIFIYYSDNNTLSGNTASNNSYYGIYIYYSDNNTLSGNTASNNNYKGIYIYYSDNNTLSGNTVNNDNDGIYLWVSNNNTLSGNTIQDNIYYGIYIYGGIESTYNLFFNNSFLCNSVHAYDSGRNTYWDNGTMGNYWDDYSGEDSNNDGIGDTPYYISGSANSQDNYPIWWDFIDISINTPNSNEFFGEIAPNFTISIDKGLARATWYTIDNGLTNIIFTGSTGTVDQTEWNKISSDFVTLTFYANNTLGVISSSEVVIVKDIANPIIIINSPKPNDLIGIITPSFSVEVTDANLDTMWYSIDGGITNTTFTENGTINQELWDALSNGTATITFYANDSAGNEAFNSVIVRVDKIIPSITIHSPIENQLFGTNVPSPMFNISVDDIFHDKMWYTLNQDSTKYFFTSPWDYINQTTWSGLPEGSVKIRFYANDSAGNVGFSEVTIRKDYTAPIIAINNPQDSDVIGAIAPSFDISIDESNLDKVWYSLNGDTNITFTGLTGTVNQTLWDALPEGNVTIRFYASDSAGNIGFQEVTVVKEITQPSPPGISGYNLLFLLGIISAMVVIIIKKRIKNNWQNRGLSY